MANDWKAQEVVSVLFAHDVTNAVTEDGRHRHEDAERYDIDVSLRGGDATDNDGRLAREDKANKYCGFGKGQESNGHVNQCGGQVANLVHQRRQD